jgi:hypothetical protein
MEHCLQERCLDENYAAAISRVGQQAVLRCEFGIERISLTGSLAKEA